VRRRAGALAPVQNLHSTTILRQSSSPAALYMKSMGNTTVIAPGARVDALCRFPVTLPAQSRGFGRRSRSNRGSGDRRSRQPHPFPSAVCRADANQGCGRCKRLRIAGAGPLSQVQRPVGRPSTTPRSGRTGVRLRPPQVPRRRPQARRSRLQQELDRGPRSGRRDARARLRGAPCQASPRPVRDPLA
jgi:hypothetical protein